MMLSIFALQTEIIRQMTEKNLRSIGDDLWGHREEGENTPPPGYPKVPDVFAGETPGKAGEKEKKEAKQEPQK